MPAPDHRQEQQLEQVTPQTTTRQPWHKPQLERLLIADTESGTMSIGVETTFHAPS